MRDALRPPMEQVQRPAAIGPAGPAGDADEGDTRAGGDRCAVGQGFEALGTGFEDHLAAAGQAQDLAAALGGGGDPPGGGAVEEGAAGLRGGLVRRDKPQEQTYRGENSHHDSRSRRFASDQRLSISSSVLSAGDFPVILSVCSI
jgi:hypothetical protein